MNLPQLPRVCEACQAEMARHLANGLALSGWYCPEHQTIAVPMIHPDGHVDGWTLVAPFADMSEAEAAMAEHLERVAVSERGTLEAEDLH